MSKLGEVQHGSEPLELNVRARQWYEASGEFVKRRDVYLHRLDAKEGAVEPFLWHVQCPMPQVLRLVAWAESVGIPVVQDPPGNIEPGWSFPPESPPVSKPQPAEATF